MTVEITQDHIDYVNSIAYTMSRTKMGYLAGVDELRSEVLVILWDLALRYDETTTVPFRAFLGLNVRNRLIDWLRREYGRADLVHSEKLLSTLGTVSLDAENDLGLVYEAPASGPSVEDSVVDRDTFATVVGVINEVCTDRQKDALLWPVTDESPKRVAQKWGMATGTVAAHRSHARTRVQAALNVA